jgi:hypothetical protein
MPDVLNSIAPIMKVMRINAPNNIAKNTVAPWKLAAAKSTIANNTVPYTQAVTIPLA